MDVDLTELSSIMVYSQVSAMVFDPEPGSEITVVGTFNSYTEESGGNYYLYLVLREARFA